VVDRETKQTWQLRSKRLRGVWLCRGGSGGGERLQPQLGREQSSAAYDQATDEARGVEDGM